MGAVAAPLLTGVGAYLSVRQAQEADKARKEAKKMTDEEAARQAALQQEAKAKQENDAKQAAALAQRKQKTTDAPALGGREGTILTSPLGAPDYAAAPTAKKTLLGA